MSYDEIGVKFNPVLIGICGGSASGKTTAASFITHFVGEDNCLLFSLDNYYFGPNDEERKHIQDYNFDRPEALDLDLAYIHLLQLKEGKTIDMPVYSFNISKRLPYTQKVSPKKVIIFEGIFSLHEKRIRDLMDIKLFYDLDGDIRLARRIIRDMSDRSRAIETVIDRYFCFVKPAFERYILPTKKYADFVIPQDNLSSLPNEIVSYNIIDKLNLKIELMDKMRRKESIRITQEDFQNRKYFEDPKDEILSLVNSEKDINKFNKIIHYIMLKLKQPYYFLYCQCIIEYLLNKHNILNNENLRTIFIENTNSYDDKIKEKINKDEKSIISIFEPNLIHRNDEIEKYLIKLFDEFKEYKVQYELITVYLTNQTFQEIKKFIEDANVKMKIITVYFGDKLLEDEERIINSNKIKSNLGELDKFYLTRENLISNFLHEINK